MKMDVLPLPFDALPHARFGRRRGVAGAITIDTLRQTHVRDDGNVVPDHSNMGTAECCRHPGIRRPFCHREKVLVESHPLDKMSIGFRLERGQVIRAQLRVGGPITVGNRVDQASRQGDDFSLRHVTP